VITKGGKGRGKGEDRSGRRFKGGGERTLKDGTQLRVRELKQKGEQ